MNWKKKVSMLVTAAAAVGIFASTAGAQSLPHTFYDLATDNNVQSNNQFNPFSDQFHKPGGDIAVITHAGGKALSVTNRTENYMGLDVKRTGLKINGQFVEGKYTIRVAGTIPTGTTVPADAHISINRSEDPWTELAAQSVASDSRDFDLMYELRATPTSIDRLDYDFRIQTRNAPTMSFIITSLVVKVEAVEGGVYEWPEPAWDNTLASMKDKFEGIFKIGNIMSPGVNLNNLEDTYVSAAFFKKHYNVVTLENAMKPVNMMPSSGSTAGFADADRVVNWANENDIDVIGHTLVWHSQSAQWLNMNADKTPLTRAVARQNMQTYINTVAGHYKGRVTTWDVVNEAFMNIGECLAKNNDWKDALRSSRCHRDSLNIDVNDHTNSQLSPWFDAYANGANAAAGESGADYIYDAFVFARLADTNAVLYYNDFNEEFPLKREAIALMAEDLNEKWKTDPRNTNPNRLLVEGLGMQSHYYGGPNPPYETMTYNLEYVDSTIARFARTGARISITELDIPMGGWRSDHKYSEDKLSAEEEAAQAKLYVDLMETYLKYRDHIDRITFWGMSDGTSWRGHGMPLLFDNSLRPKAAYTAIMGINLSGVPVRNADAAVPRASAASLVSVRGRTLSVSGSPDTRMQVRVVNLAGRTVAKHNVRGGSSVQLRKLPAGAYIIEAKRVRDGVKTVSRVTLR